MCRLTRDVLLMRPPRILYSRSELYAVPTLFGMSLRPRPTDRSHTSLRCFTPLSGGLATTTLVRLVPSMAMEAVLLGAWCTAGQLAQKLSNLSVRELPILRQALLFEL